MEEPTLLMPVQRVVGGVEIENDPLGRRLVRLEEEGDEQALDRHRVVADLVVAARRHRRVFEPVERALAGERRTTPALGDELAGERRQHRIVAQLVVIDQVLVAERDAEYALGHHRLDRVLDLGLDPAVVEAGREPGHEPDGTIRRAEQQRPRIGRDLAAIERSHHLATLDHSITEQVAATLCRHRGAPLCQLKSLWQKSYARFRAPMHLLL
jgi:hypothetical protein